MNIQIILGILGGFLLACIAVVLLGLTVMTDADWACIDTPAFSTAESECIENYYKGLPNKGLSNDYH